MSIRTLLTLAGFAAAIPFAFAHEGHEHAAATAKSDSYPLTTCIVSGDKLGEMGDPVKYTYKQPGKPDRVIEFCCKDCIKDFEKDPTKYLAQLDAATAGQPGTAAKSTGTAGNSAMAGCCAAGETDTCCALVKAYVPVAEALAADDLAQAQSAAATLARQAKASDMTKIYQASIPVIHAADIATARNAFKALSSEITPLVQNNKDYVVMHCPMAKADWVQTDANVRNPYYGKAMLSCGMPKK